MVTYSKKIEKQTQTILRKMFGYTSIKNALYEQYKLKKELEKLTYKNINCITFNDIRYLGSLDDEIYIKYAKYRTVKKITDLYINVVELQHFNSKEWETYNGNKRIRKN